jgi:hypothetical protein
MMAAGLRATAKAVDHPPEPKIGAPVLDPTRTAGADTRFAFAGDRLSVRSIAQRLRACAARATLRDSFRPHR